MHPELQQYLQGISPPASRFHVVWGGGTMPLDLACYTCDHLPPLDFVTSVRSVVLRGREVLVMRNQDGVVHVMPGGRREGGETIEQTLRREVQEEAGWDVRPVALLGCLHFHHLAPKPAGYHYPYPDFVSLVYLSHASRHLPEARVPDDYEHTSAFMSIPDVDTLSLERESQFYLGVVRDRVLAGGASQA